jgi:hypothetical protein
MSPHSNLANKVCLTGEGTEAQGGDGICPASLS